ncbi:MAG: hypothetical protein ACKO8L_11475 [Flavobacterium sp.]
MNIHEFQKLCDVIPDFFNDKEKEDKIIQIVDLKHFIECYNSDIKIIECAERKLNLVELNSNRIGVVFFELKKISQQNSFVEELSNEIFHSNLRYKELWFVFVEEKTTTDFDPFVKFITENELSSTFRKIFLFNFFQSVIHQLN